MVKGPDIFAVEIEAVPEFQPCRARLKHGRILRAVLLLVVVDRNPPP